MDFRQFYAAAEFILRGDNPYREGSGVLTAWGGPYPYPPLPGSPGHAPHCVVRSRPPGSSSWRCLVLVALAVPYVLGVRDWRCYGLVLAVAAGDLGDPDGQRHTLVRAGCSRRLALPRAACSPLRSRSVSRSPRSSSSGRSSCGWRRLGGSWRRRSPARRRGDCSSRRGPSSASRASSTTRHSFDGSSTPSATTPTPRTSSASTSACRRP